MRRHAKAATAGSTNRRADSPTSNRPRIAVLGLALLAFSVALGVSLASASKEVVTYFGNESGSGALGGQFNTPRDPAVNKSGAGPADVGDIYVADDANNRIQRFDKNGNFISAWGADVDATPIGGNDFEICTLAAECKAGVAVGGNTTAAGNGALDNPQSVAVDNDTGLVYVSDRDNRRVSVYDGAGAFQRSFGFDVAEAGPGNTGTAYEICVAANGDVCKAGVGAATPGAGQFHTSTTANAYGIAVSQPDGNAATGTVFLANSGARRVNTYALDGAGPSSFGSATNFGTNQPTKLAVDSKGIVYASDSNSGAQIDRYDSENANGGGVVFLASIAAPPLLTGGATATSGLAVDPDTDGAGTDEDILYVLRDPTTGNTAVQQFGPTNDPGLTAAPTAVDDTHGAAAGFGVVNGLGLNETEGKLFVGATSNVAGTGAGHRVYVLGDIPSPPTAAIDPVTTFDATSATFSGQVNPNGALIGYHFEYVTDAQFQIDGFTSALRFPEADVGVGLGSSNVAVSQQPQALSPNTLYHVRLLAKRSFSPLTAPSGEVSFTTSAAAPEISTAPTYAKTSSALLAGIVNPNGQATSYHFEYGSQGPCGTSPCASTEVEAAGSGSEAVLAKASISKLTPDTTYHYRLLASNANGTTSGPERTVVTERTTSRLPDHRTYEMVSPPDKNGGEANAAGESNIAIAPSGDAVLFSSFVSFAEPQSSPFTNIYRATRSAQSWETRNIGPSLPDHTGVPLVTAVFSVSPDLSRVVWAANPNPSTLPGVEVNQLALYRQTDVPNGAFDLVFDGFSGAGEDFGVSTPDLSHVLFESTEIAAPGGAGAPGLYEWTDGEVRFVGRLPDGSPATGSSSLGGGANVGALTRSAISDDGSRIIFTANNSKLYMREDGTTTIDVSPSQRTPTDPAGSAPMDYEGASTDGSRVFFTTKEKLLNTDTDSSYDVYQYNVETEVLRLISPDTDLSDGETEVVAGAATLGMGDDGRSFYFVAAGRLLPDQPRVNGPSMYAWRDDGTPSGELRYVTTVSVGDELNWDFRPSFRFTLSQVSRSGRYLLFTSAHKIGPYDNAGHQEIYRYDNLEDRLDCVSCRPDGTVPTGDAALQTDLGVGGLTLSFSNYMPHNVLDDGRVYFDSNDSLLPSDSNGKRDVYQWRDGQLSLISTGSDGSDSAFGDSTPDGDDVFLFTREPLVGIDVDDALDVYTARAGGGLASQNPTFAPGCQGDACQPPPAALNDSTPSSSSFQGPGNASPKPSRARCAKGKRKVRRNGKARCVKRHAKRTNHRNANKTRRASR